MPAAVLLGLAAWAAAAAAGVSLFRGRATIRSRVAGADAVDMSGVAPFGSIASRRARRSERRLERRPSDQLIDAAIEVAGAVRAGGSIVQGLDRAAEQVGAPLGARLGSIVESTGSGTHLQVALQRWSGETHDPDVHLVSAVLQMHRRTGGDLPVVLDQLAETLRERLAARREISSMTAQARLSGVVVGLLPIGFFGFLALTSPGEMASVLASPIGLASVGGGLILEGCAFLWIRQILRSGER